MPQISTTGSDPTKSSGDWLTEECDCIFEIDEGYREEGAGTEDYRGLISAHVVVSSSPSQVGKKIKDVPFWYLKNQNRVFEFACALAIYSKPQWEQDVKLGAAPNIPLENSAGMLFATPVRHKKWREPEDTNYWKGRLNDARAKASRGEDGAQKEVEKVERVLAAKQGMLQIGGESGFTYWAIGDTEADHLYLTPAQLALYPHGLPTKQGTLRKRGTPPPGAMGQGQGAKLPPKPSNGGNGHSQPPQQTAPAGAAAGVGGDFF